MEVRLCNESDAEAIAAFFDDVILYLDNHINYPKWRYKEYPSYQTILPAIKKSTLYACYDNGKVIGSFVLNDNPQGDYDAGKWSKSLKPGEYLVIHSFATSPEHYNKGIGKFMLEQSIIIAKEKNAKALRIDVVPSNTPAKSFFKKNGFLHVGEYDLKRGFEDIPTFSLFELNFDDE